MPNTPVFTNGVKYIKIAKQDSGSVDNSIELQNLTDIRIKFSDINNPVQYNVASITEYSTYYLYSIFPLDITSSADQEILDYKVSASITSSQNYSNSPFTLINYSNVTSLNNPLGYFNSSSGEWNLNNTPNIYLNITCSITFDWSPDSPPTTRISGSIFLYNLNNGTSFTLSPVPIVNTPGNINNWIASGSFTPIEGDKYVVRINTGAGAVGGTYNTVSSASLIITQSFAPEASNYDIVVLEPYSGYNFYNSDCNVIQNNVDANNISELFMDVDFNGGQIVAQNQAAILSGNASRAQVQPWNYSYRSHISGRYVGKQQNAIALNTYTGPTSYVSGSSSIYGYTGSWPGDSASPGVIVPGNIVIQWLDSCIYEMNYGGPGYPENVNGGGISMGNIYLVGETKDDVATITPGTDIYYDILEKTFPSGSPAFQYQYTNAPALPNQLNITYPSLTLPSATYYVASNNVQFGGGTAWGGFYPTGSPVSFPTPGIPSGVPFLVINGLSFNTPLANININGDLYQDESTYTPVSDVLNSLNDGNRWFVSFYSGSGTYISSSTITNLTGGLPPSCSTTLQQVGFPFEIDQVYQSNSPFYYGAFTFKNPTVVKNFFSSSYSGSSNVIPIGSYASVTGSGISTNISNTGILITKAQTPTNGLTIFGLPNSNFAGAGQGYILSQYPKKVITENLDYILKKYGNKP
jgi:hypothetical protein